MENAFESYQLWKKTLKDRMPSDWAKEIEAFETELELKKQGKIEDKVFAETRLRRGVYGQRYDNGKRHDGREEKKISYPTSGKITKGPNTEWDAPGMQRIKIPWGGMNPEQMDVLADLAEEYSDSICHVTTRQDFQLHFVHIEDTPTIFRRLAAVGITTREACGNSIRNVTACPLAGVCRDQAYDVTPYAEVMFRYLLGHPDVQDFGRKFKIAFSGCKHNPCGLTTMHDLGLIATTKIVNGVDTRGFEYYVGGGLGAIPFKAKLFSDFVPEEELLPLTQAVSRIFARYGEKKKRNRARIKFLVNDWGMEKFKEMVLEERKTLKPDPRWQELISKVKDFKEGPKKDAGKLTQSSQDPDYAQWIKNNCYSQRQEGFYVVTVSLPLGDITSNQMRDLANLVRKYVKDTARTTVEQNIVLRWMAESDLPSLYEDLKKINLAEPVANSIVDVTACPGTDTCKLGVSSSRGLAAELRRHLAEKSMELDEAIRNLRIKVSGCFNACGQQHAADIGFYGISRKVGNHLVPHFQLLLGGQWTENAAEYGLVTAGIPSKAVPQTVDRLTEMFIKEREKDESFQNFIKRVGKVKIKQALVDLMEVPEYEKDPSYYVDWSDVREFTISDIGKGECAGEIVSLTDFGLKEADRQIFEAQISFDGGNLVKAAETAYRSMVTAAQGLIKDEDPDVSNDADKIIDEFKTRFYDTKKFFDIAQGDKFANYLFKARMTDFSSLDEDHVRMQLEEAQLFIDAAYSCNAKMSMQKTAEPRGT